MSNTLQNIANAVADAVQDFGTYSARSAAQANGISAGSQAAQGAFNQASANNANMIGDARIAQQYGFNSAQAAAANEFTQAMWNQSAAYNDASWDKTAAWNEKMWERAAEWNEMMAQRQMDFNHKEAELNRKWQENMSNTSYQRAMADMEKAGINPIMAAMGGASGGGGSAASVGGTQMGGASMGQSYINPMSGQGASGGLLNGESASVGNYTGQMEYMGGMLGMMSAAISGIAAALKYAGDGDKSIAGAFMDMLGEMTKKNFNNPNTKYNAAKRAAERTGKAVQYYIDRGLHPNKYNE